MWGLSAGKLSYCLTPVGAFWLRNAGDPIEHVLKERMQNPRSFTVAMGRGNLLPNLKNGKASVSSSSGMVGWSSTWFPHPRMQRYLSAHWGWSCIIFPPQSDDIGHPSSVSFFTGIAHFFSIKEKKQT